MLLVNFSPASGKSMAEWDDIDKKIWETLQKPHPDETDQTWLTPEMRMIVIDKMLKEAENQSFSNSSNRDQAEKVLVMLGHEETVRRLVEKMKNPKARLGALSEATEIALPYLMPMVYSGSTEDPNEYGTPGWDVILLPVRDRAIGSVLGCIRDGRNFPAETRQWGKRMANMESKYWDGRFISLITSWWEHNQTAILEKRYADATWLPRYKGRPSVLDREEIQERRADEERKHFPWVSGGGPVIATIRSQPWLFISMGVVAALATATMLGFKYLAKAR